MELTLDLISLIGLLAAVNLLYVGALVQWGDGRSLLAARFFALMAFVGAWWCFWLIINPAGFAEAHPRFIFMSQLFSGFFGPLLFLFTLAYTGIITNWKGKYAWLLLPGAFGTVGVILWVVTPIPDDALAQIGEMAVAFYAGDGMYDPAFIALHASWFQPLQIGHMLQLYVFTLTSIGIFVWKGLTLTVERDRGDARMLASVYGVVLAGITLTNLLPTLGFGAVWIRVAAILPFPFILILWLFVRRRVQTVARLTKEREAMQAYLPVGAVEHLLEEGESGSRGKKWEAAVLFADIRGFTTMSEQVIPERLVAWIDRFFSEMSEDILAEEGMVDKLIGDAVLAVFGVPHALENPSENALRAALRMQDTLRRLNETYPLSPGLVTRMGIGLHYGPVIAGSVGGRRRTYTVFGDTVNTAHRIEQVTKEVDASLLLSQDVYEQLSSESRGAIIPFGKHPLKGKRKPVLVYGMPNREAPVDAQGLLKA